MGCFGRHSHYTHHESKKKSLYSRRRHCMYRCIIMHATDTWATPRSALHTFSYNKLASTTPTLPIYLISTDCGAPNFIAKDQRRSLQLSTIFPEQQNVQKSGSRRAHEKKIHMNVNENKRKRECRQNHNGEVETEKEKKTNKYII